MDYSGGDSPPYFEIAYQPLNMQQNYSAASIKVLFFEIGARGFRNTYDIYM